MKRIRMTTSRRAIVGVLLASVILFSGCGQQEQIAAGPQAVPVSSVSVEKERLLLYTDLPGRVVPCLIAEIRPQVSGLIQERLFTEGAEVEAGAVLYQIDPAPYKAAVSNASAALILAKANYANALAGRSRAEANQANAKASLTVAEAKVAAVQAAREVAKTVLSAAQARQTSAEANLVPLRLRAERFQELLASKAVSQQDFDDVDAARRQSEAGIESAQAAVHGAEAELLRADAAIQVAIADVERAKAGILGAAAEFEGATAGIESAKAAIASAEASLESANINLGYTKITSPISGRIGRSSVTVGALVTGHQPQSLATIQQMDQMYVDVPQATAELLRLQRRLADGRLTPNGGKTQVKLLMEDGKPYPLAGVLQFRDVSVDPSTGSLTVRMIFPNPKRMLLPGMYVRAQVEEGVKEDAILIPQQAVSRDSKGDPMVMLVDAGNQAQVKMVKLDRAIGSRWLVSSGLQSGDRIVTEGLQRLRSGMLVREKEAINPGVATPEDSVQQ